LNALVDGEKISYLVSDIARILGYADGTALVSKASKSIMVYTHRDVPDLRVRRARFISHDGLEGFLLVTNRPGASALMAWIEEEVIPTIKSLPPKSHEIPCLDNQLLAAYQHMKHNRIQAEKSQSFKDIYEKTGKIAKVLLSYMDHYIPKDSPMYAETKEKLSELSRLDQNGEM
jgi:prophage antirepressor-like protein